ncbi:chain-length determining protein [Brevundimonas sp.]|jgi:BexC/CtrB/KpsE family polysaccharide export inner-membrane protein|uniref:chain-length determining protein n=1 Tax=Brevundimonas sp. TaxID=1871086 RepID=UPI0025BD4C1F|nr:chain-length determining protein [Brevundimonas sp.]MBA4332282.1 chain-length determining protein [Brevundimonas sp.]
MNQNKVNYLGPIDRIAPKLSRPGNWPRLPVSFLLVVCLPVLAAAVYYLFFAAPQYVSEARFIVRAPAQEQPSSFDFALQGVGLSSTQTDVFVVHEYIMSRDGLAQLARRMDIGAALARPGLDFWARYPRPWETKSEESLFSAYKRFVEVGYDSTKGISTIRVKAFTPEEAQRANAALLDGGEGLINRLNERAYEDAIREANLVATESEERLAASQRALAAFRNREQFIDPARSAQEGTSLIGDLMGQLAVLRAERAQLAEQVPSSPQLAILDSRIRAFDAQISVERQKLAGAASSLAPKIGAYETLVLEREMADRAVAQSRLALDSAQKQARGKRLYLQRIVEPNRPDAPAEPHGWLSLLTVLASCLAIYSIGWLIVASVREHRQG